MIKLQIEDYCQNCSEFEPHVEKVDISSSDLYSYEKVERTDTTITCTHRQRCDCIEEYIQKQVKNKCQY